jgi:SAM-dependent methyltransferase
MANKDFKWRWAHVDQSERTEYYVDIINQSRPDDEPSNFPHAMVWIDAQPGERILEVGCGNGAVARALARHVPEIASIIGVDASEAMIAEARQRAGGQDLAVTFEVADAASLPFADCSFDRVYAMETFVILPDPRQAFMELARVTRPGGHVLVRETECDTHALLGDDLELTRRLMRFVGDSEYNGAVARQIIGWCKELGWETQAIPAVNVSEALSDRLLLLLREWLADAEAAGIATGDECERLMADLKRRHETNCFLSYNVNFRITVTKPCEQA